MYHTYKVQIIGLVSTKKINKFLFVSNDTESPDVKPWFLLQIDRYHHDSVGKARSIQHSGTFYIIYNGGDLFEIRQVSIVPDIDLNYEQSEAAMIAPRFKMPIWRNAQPWPWEVIEHTIESMAVSRRLMSQIHDEIYLYAAEIS